MEDEGIYYYFKHVDGRHTMILVDSQQRAHAFRRLRGDALSSRRDARRDSSQEFVHEWTLQREVQPGTLALDDFDFETPSRRPQGRDQAQAQPRACGLRGLRLSGRVLQKRRRRSLRRGPAWTSWQCQFELVRGSANARGVTVGSLFKLTRAPAQRPELRVPGASLASTSSRYTPVRGARGRPATKCRCTLHRPRQQAAVPAAAHARYKPFVQGPQTAVVVGPGGEEIYHRQVRPREGAVPLGPRRQERREELVLGARVAPVGRQELGHASHIPRIGQEVVVDFLEGDPDQPLITGRVYNAEQMPPWELPANKTQSGILTRSQQGRRRRQRQRDPLRGQEGLRAALDPRREEPGHRGRERRDALGRPRPHEDDRPRRDQSRQARPHGDGRQQRDDHDRRQSHGDGGHQRDDHDRRQSHRDGRRQREHHDRRQPHRARSAPTRHHRRRQPQHRRRRQRDASRLALHRTHDGRRQRDASTVGASAGGRSVDQRRTKRSIGRRSTESRRTIGVESEIARSVGKDDSLTVGKNLSINAGDSITITTGSASITMKKDGTIVIKGKDITVEGSGKINVKAGSNITMKGSKILQN